MNTASVSEALTVFTVFTTWAVFTAFPLHAKIAHMVIAIFLFIGSMFLGTSLLRFVPLKWHLPELVAASIASGLTVGTWIIFLACWLINYTYGPFIALAIIGLLIAFSWQKNRLYPLQIHTLASYSRSDCIIWASISLLTTIVLGNLFYTHMLWNSNGTYMSGGSTWGDLALHLSLITRFAHQESFTWDLPIMYGANLSYPFLMDFLSGILHRLGFSLRAALIVPGLPLALALIQLLFFVGKRLTGSALAAALVIILFLGNGGIGGLESFWHDWQASNVSLVSFLGKMDKGYAHTPEEGGILFSNITVDYLLPQRGILMGLPLFMLATIFLWQAWHTPKQASRYLGSVAVIGGLLPFAHAHTFFVLAGVMGYLTAVQVIKIKSLATPWVTAWISMITLAAPQIIWQLSSNFTDTFTRPQFGWMKRAEENIVVFWLRNWGMAILFAFGNFWVITKLLKKRSDFYLHWYTPLMILFLLTNVYVFQPYAYDNMKFMIYSYFAVCLFMSLVVANALTNPHIIKKIAGVAIVVITTIVGILSITRETYAIWSFSESIDRQAAQQLDLLIPVEARVLTSDQHTHFVPTLTGRRIMLGYRGWLWSYGLNYHQLEGDITQIYSGSPITPQLLKKYDISFVVIGPTEKKQYRVNETYFSTHATLLMSTNRYQVYDVRVVRQ